MGLFTGASNLIGGLISIPVLPSEIPLAPTEGDCSTVPCSSGRGDFCTTVAAWEVVLPTSLWLTQKPFLSNSQSLLLFYGRGRAIFVEL